MTDYSKYTILVVDDEIEIRSLLGQWIESYDFKVLYAQNGNDAFNIIQESKIDYLITDIQMPICTGPQLLERINNHQKKIPSIILATVDNEIDQGYFAQNNILSVLKKPFDLDKLMTLIFGAINADSHSI